MSEAPALVTPLPRKRGRRRTFEDIEVFQQLTQILLDGGMSAFSLPRLAERVRCTHQSISERFGSRAALLQAYRAWFTSIFLERADEILETVPSAVEQIRRLLLMPIDQRIVGPGRAQSPGYWVTLTLEMQRDPALAAAIADSQATLIPLFARVVAEGQQRGEFLAGDPELIAEALLTSTTGAAVLWLLRPIGDPLEDMARCFEGTLTRFTP
jgi:AcrR family transcriptional regulator